MDELSAGVVVVLTASDGAVGALDARLKPGVPATPLALERPAEVDTASEVERLRKPWVVVSGVDKVVVVKLGSWSPSLEAFSRLAKLAALPDSGSVGSADACSGITRPAAHSWVHGDRYEIYEPTVADGDRGAPRVVASTISWVVAEDAPPRLPLPASTVQNTAKASSDPCCRRMATNVLKCVSNHCHAILYSLVLLVSMHTHIQLVYETYVPILGAAYPVASRRTSGHGSIQGAAPVLHARRTRFGAGGWARSH